MLHYKQLGKGPAVLIIHGLFGMLDNWMGIAKALSHRYSVYLIDAPHHGKSPHKGDFTYKAMSEMLRALVEQLHLDEFALIGHSMGGKIAMTFAQFYPEYIDKLIIVDIGPKAYPIHHDIILDALNSIDFNEVKSRQEVIERLKTYLSEEDVVQFLAKNLYWKEKGKLAFKFNLPVITKSISNVGAQTMHRMMDKPTLFIKGSRSNYILDQDLEEIKTYFVCAQLRTISQAGHWVHAEQPALFLKELSGFLELN